MKTDLKVLLLETEDHEAERIEEQLQKVGVALQVHRAENPALFFDYLFQHRPDFILLGHKLPEVNGFEVLTVLRQKEPEIPCVMILGTGWAEREIESLEQSGIHYVLKNRLSRLVPVVQRVLHDAAKRKEQLKLERTLARDGEYFRTLVDHIAAYAICRLDEEGRIHSWNNGAESFNGYNASEMIGRHFSCFYPDELVADGHPQRVLGQAAVHGHFQEEIQLLRKGSVPFWANVSLTLLPEMAEMKRAFALVACDITLRKQTEAERERLLQEFQSTLSNVKILSGLVPICASCKKVRDYKGHWHSLESFLREHSEATLTHEFCEDCAKNIQPVAVAAAV